jgi:hypothetical protein
MTTQAMRSIRRAQAIWKTGEGRKNDCDPVLLGGKIIARYSMLGYDFVKV